MSMQATREAIWVATVEDKPGGLAAKLTPLAEAGANLRFVVARRGDAGLGGEAPDPGVVFVTPLEGDRQQNAARVAGFHVSTSMHGVRAEAPDRSGLGEVVTTTLAEAGINLRGLSAAAIDGRCAIHLALDSDDDADRAVELLKQLH